MEKTVKQNLEKVEAEYLATEQFLFDNQDLPIKTLLELHQKQIKLEGLRTWLRNIEALYNAPKVIPLN